MGIKKGIGLADDGIDDLAGGVVGHFDGAALPVGAGTAVAGAGGELEGVPERTGIPEADEAGAAGAYRGIDIAGNGDREQRFGHERAAGGGGGDERGAAFVGDERAFRAERYDAGGHVAFGGVGDGFKSPGGAEADGEEQKESERNGSHGSSGRRAETARKLFTLIS